MQVLLLPGDDRITVDPAWRYREVDLPHIGPLTDPQPVADTLVSLIDD